MRSITENVRRAAQDMDIDFIRYPLSDESNQHDYNGKSVKIFITDQNGVAVETKIDLGVHKRLEIEQEEYCLRQRRRLVAY